MPEKEDSVAASFQILSRPEQSTEQVIHKKVGRLLSDLIEINGYITASKDDGKM